MENPVVVVGSGISGLNFALKIADHRPVVVLTKKNTAESATNYAQGGIASVLDQYDSFESHIEDTMKCGSFHNNPLVVREIIEAGPKSIQDLLDYGVKFQTFEGRLALTREGGHSANRIAFVGDYTGRDIERALVENVKKHSNITVIEHAFALDVHLEGGQVAGIFYAIDESVQFLATNAVVLATGGIGQLYKFTTNPEISTGDGIAIAIRAGAKVQDMEFVQFHPTAFMGSGRPFLISEAVRGEGAKLVRANGEQFVDSLAPRDVVAQAIFAETGPIYLDCRQHSAEFLRSRFPTIYQELLKSGLKMESNLIPISPAAHYLCGGIVVNLNGFTNINGLYAFGECAYTGLHGANRLASNSLLEALVVSSRLANKLKDLPVVSLNEVEIVNPNFAPSDNGLSELRELMWQKVGIVRNSADLSEAIAYLEKELKLVSAGNFAYKNMLLVSLTIAKAALARKSSLGCHLVG